MDPRHLKIGGAIVGVLVVLLGGMVVVGVVGVPSVEDMTNEWGDVDDDRVEVKTQLTIDNPNPLGLGYGISSVEYVLEGNDIELATGTVDELDIPRGQSTLNLSTDLHTAAIPPWWASHVQNDEVTELDIVATINASLGPIQRSPSITRSDTIETDIITTIEDGLEGYEGRHEGPEIGIAPLTERPAVEIRDTGAEWGEVTDDRTQVLFHMDIHNPNDYPIPTPAFTGEIVMNEVTIGAWDAHDVELVRGTYDTMIPPGETRELTFGVTLENEQIGEWFPTHVALEEFTDASMSVQLAMSIAGETFVIPPEGDAFRCEFTFQTAIFVEQDSGILDRDCGVEMSVLSPPSEEQLDSLGATISESELEEHLGLLILDDRPHTVALR